MSKNENNPLIKSIVSTVTKAFKVDPKRKDPLPRKGQYAFSNSVLNKKQQKQAAINPETLKRLSETDPIIWAIKRVIKSYISQTKWDIVPDTQKIEKELDRWEDDIISSLNPYGIEEPIAFESKLIDRELYNQMKDKVGFILDDNSITLDDKKERIRWLFKVFTKNVRQQAESHVSEVKRIFEHPNKTESSFRALLELVLDDLLTYDAGIIIKNYDYLDSLAELYTVPGNEVKIYRNEDRTVPEPPEAAYVWEDQGVERAEFTNDELVYMMSNPKQNGYGTSPLEVAAYVITASLYADQYNIDFFKNSNVPPGIVNLGPDVNEDQRELFQQLWDQEVQGSGGLHRLVITSGSEKLQFVPMREMSNRDMQMMEYMKWAAAIKCACYGLSPQDIGFVLDFHRTTAEVQSDLSQRRGVKSVLNLLESYFNEEIVKSEYTFSDVKFEWQIDEDKDNVQQAQIDKIDIDTGVISINERRKKLGKKSIEGGDRHIIKSGAGMIPVEDLDRVDEPMDSVQQEAAPGIEGLGGEIEPQGFDQFSQDTPNSPKIDSVNGDPGRPASGDGDNLNLSVNSKLPSDKQRSHLDETVNELKKKGIDATIKIGFIEDGEEDVSKKKNNSKE